MRDLESNATIIYRMQDSVKRRMTNILRWSEKYTKTDMVYLMKGGFWLTISQIIGTLTSLATSVAFANWLPQETYGIFRYVLSVVPILAIPTLAGMDTATTRAVAQGKESTAYAALSLKMRWGVWGALGSLVVAAYYYAQGDTRLMFLFLIAAAFIPLMEPFNLFVAFLTGKKDFKLRTYYGTLTRIVPTIVLIAITFFTNNIFILVGGYFMAYTLTRFIAWTRVSRNVPKDGDIDHAALGFGKHLSAMGILSTLSTSLDSILIFHFGGGAALAGYYLAIVPYSQLSSAFSNLNIIALPKLSLQTTASLVHTLPRKAARSFAVILPIVLIYLVAAPTLFSLLYPAYVSYASLSSLFMLQLLFFPIGMFSTAFIALGERKKLYLSSTTYAIVRIVLLLVLTPLYGVWGAAAALLISAFIINIIKIILFFRLQ